MKDTSKMELDWTYNEEGHSFQLWSVGHKGGEDQVDQNHDDGGEWLGTKGQQLGSGHGRLSDGI